MVDTADDTSEDPGKPSLDDSVAGAGGVQTGPDVAVRSDHDLPAGSSERFATLRHPDTGPTTEGVRIAAVEAAVAAGLAPSTSRSRSEPLLAEPCLSLPDWTDPPTGQVPRVLLDAPVADGSEEALGTPRGPSWREHGSDWEDDDLDLSFLSDGGPDPRIATSELGAGDLPLDIAFDDLEVPVVPVARSGATAGEGYGPEDAAWAALLAGEHDQGDRWEPGDPGGPGSTIPELDGPKRSRRKRSAAHRGAHLTRPPVPQPAATRPDRSQLTDPSQLSGASSDVSSGEESVVENRSSGLGPSGGTGPGAGAAPAGEPLPASSARRSREPFGPRTSRNRAAGPGGPQGASGSQAPQGSRPQQGSRAPQGARGPQGPGRPRGRVPTGDAAPPKRRDPVLATVTGLAAGAVALGCFLAGAQASLVLVALLVAVATGELLGNLRRAGHRPATPLALVAAPALVVGAYLRGTSALPLVLALTVVIAMLWYLMGGRGERPATDLGLTLLAVIWIGGLGSFAGLLLAPGTFPHRHGVGFLAAAVAVTVANDVGAYAVGARWGRHRIAPSVSPSKSLEGLLAGAVLSVLVGALVVSHIHPFDLSQGLAVGLAAAVLAPLGDLAESLVKRDIGVKDMGSLLPAHGGVFDRVDGMLFVLPAVYYLVEAFHLS